MVPNREAVLISEGPLSKAPLCIPYHKTLQGVMCFDYCHTLDLLVTGSLDHMVCVWNPYVPTKPVAMLDGHKTTILSVIISKEDRFVFSLSQDLVRNSLDS